MREAVITNECPACPAPQGQVGGDAFVACVLVSQRAVEARRSIQGEALTTHQPVEAGRAGERVHRRAVVGLIGAGQTIDGEYLGIDGQRPADGVDEVALLV